MDSPLDLDPFSDDDASENPPSIDDDASADDDYIEGAENSTDNPLSPVQNYTVLTQSDIKRLQETAINEVSSVLSISRVSACLLLYHYNWSVIKLHEAWFDDEERVRKTVGLPNRNQVGASSPNSKTLTCEICFDVVSCDKIRSAACDHPYCIDCWKQYVDINISEGPDTCLNLRCPEPSCDVAVGGDMIHELASELNKNKYDLFLFRSYVEKNKKMKWCPGPACENAVSYESDGVRTNSDVTCVCYHSFCWICNEEAHSPVDCETVSRWITKNNSESENITYIIAYTKPCPQCKKLIEKSHGCMHMTCKCGFEFCWLCLGDWSNCSSHSHICNRLYSEENAKKIEEKITEEEKKRRTARSYLERYTHYYERWASNDFSRKKAIQHLMEHSAVQIRTLSMTYGKSEDDFEFINEAWKQVVECRRVLKWTYAYGYYLPESEEAKKDFFEYAQGEAEAALERLHRCVEKDLRRFLRGDKKEEVFNAFRVRLMNLTSVNKNYFENLVRELENGMLAEVHVKSYAGVKRGKETVGESSNRKGLITARRPNINMIQPPDPDRAV